jgi:hypothetical protein
MIYFALLTQYLNEDLKPAFTEFLELTVFSLSFLNHAERLSLGSAAFVLKLTVS